jgi:hypothetical protein
VTSRPLFVVSLRPEPGVDGLRALRAALRTLLRRHGLRCVRITTAPGSDPLEHAHASPVLIDGTAES